MVSLHTSFSEKVKKKGEGGLGIMVSDELIKDVVAVEESTQE